MSKKKTSFIEEFKTFISQGSVMDLAVGIVIGSAFTKIVNSLVNDIIMPIVGLLAGGVNFTNLAITIPNFFGTGDAAVIRYGNFIQNIVDFLIIAFSIFIAIRTVNKINAEAKAKAEKAKEKAVAKAAELKKTKKSTKK